MARALSIKQPWASWICPSEAIKNAWNKIEWPELPKDVENRNWPHLPTYKGTLLIHASKKVEKNAWDYFWEMNPFPGGEKEYPTGCIIGMVDLVGANMSSSSEWYAPGNIALMFRNYKRFELPIYIPGQLGIFNVPDDVLEKGLCMEERPAYGEDWRDGGYVDEKGKNIIVAQQNNEQYGIFRVTKIDDDMPVETRKVRGTMVSRDRGEVEKSLESLAKDRRWPKYAPIEDGQETDGPEPDPETVNREVAENEPEITEEIESPLPTEKIVRVKVDSIDADKILRKKILAVASLEAEKKLSNKRYSDEINALNNEIYSLAEEDSFTHKKCKIEWDWDDGVKRYVDPESGTIVETEAITDDERYQQTKLNLQDRVDDSDAPDDIEDHEYQPAEDDVMDDTDEDPDFDGFE